MNIFFLDHNLTLCAQSHCDQHVVKMILESAQILCTVLHQQGMEAPYRPTHQNHPCVLWAGKSLDNWLWLKNLISELNKEYQYRFMHDEPHRSAQVVSLLSLPPIPSVGVTERPQVVPEQYKVPGDPVIAYRRFYLGEKRRLLTYTRRTPQKWINFKC